LRRGLRDLQLLCHPIAGGVARLPWRRSQTSLQASWRILHEGYMRQAGTAEPRPQLEAVLQRLLIVVVVGRVFYDDSVISFADLSPLLGFGFPLLRDLDSLRGAAARRRTSSSRPARHKTSARLLTSNDYSARGYDYLPPSTGARRSTLGPGTPCTAACP
jgi:hypothetical protein